MLPDVQSRLQSYVEAFLRQDEELYPQAVPNRDALAYLEAQIPLLDCPCPEIEKTYYFRWWTLRKHWKQTPYGHVMSEFLPDVPWAGPYNTINCAVGHHLREGRWLKDPGGWLREYILFWLNGHGDALSYSAWLASAVEDYLSIHPDPALERACLPPLMELYRRREETALHSCGLFWSADGRDGMELSISGSGIRPTLNSYMYGDAIAISRMARRAGKAEDAEAYACRAAKIKALMDRLLWDGDFYRTIPCQREEPIPQDHRPAVPSQRRVRELTGYIPWYFGIPDQDKAGAFAQLMDEEGFAAPYGLTTAERRHPRFLFQHEHECLWNGYVWPFATAQTLSAMAAMLRRSPDAPLSKEDFYGMLFTYARSHRLTKENGEPCMWIDEVMHPFTGEWSARRELMADHWQQKRGGYERGKDYNHSTYCDLILGDLLGIRFDANGPKAEPLIPDSWDYFCVTHLTQDDWTVLFDRDGTRYGMGKGLRYFKGNASAPETEKGKA